MSSSLRKQSWYCPKCKQKWNTFVVLAHIYQDLPPAKCLVCGTDMEVRTE